MICLDDDFRKEALGGLRADDTMRLARFRSLGHWAWRAEK